MYKALNKVYTGMTLFTLTCVREGVIENVLEREHVEKQVYDNRFGVFAQIPFPNYVDYATYKQFCE